MANDSVSYSRAGDVFHYRWAARRCLRLIYPNSSVKEIYIEGSSEAEKAGEYVIDVSEYSICEDGKKKIDYYQLKHTTVRKDEPFTISDLKDTFIGFAARYLQHKNESDPEISNISFTVITNRTIADSFKKNLSAIVAKGKVNNGFQKTIEKYSRLKGDDLVSFCGIIQLEDSEGNYNVQQDELRIELAQLKAGAVDHAQLDSLESLVKEKVLPDSDGRINREEVLKRFHITSDRQLYPAPAIWENVGNLIEREIHAVIKNKIDSSLHPIIVHAAGGVGKSVFCRQLISSLPEGSLGIAYDCFGAGSYRNPSETRHTYRDALLQIINELASKGLCNPLLPVGFSSDKDLLGKFLYELEIAVKSLKKVIGSAKLYILFDAADNAEMAAKEYNQTCFAHGLLREKMPDGCKLVLLCRTERIQLLKPPSFITQLELEIFSKEETIENLRKWFPKANEQDGIEFHRLTSGNPRVQANALDVKYDLIHELLSSFGPSGTTVEKQIELQLNTALSKIKDLIPQEHHPQVNSICQGLASLPPHIPIDVLSKVANVSIEHVKSFVSDIGRSLWLSDTSIQFRDEPTETWFRNTFLATKEDYEEYITALEPLAHQLSYVAEVLPQLYLQAGQYDKLITIALSDNYLPENNPIDARNIRVYRLQFAFKAALKLKNYKGAIKLAMRAGEEVAGIQRQLDLFRSNIDLLVILQSKEKVQEIAFKRLLSSTWDGSENVYSASLLSGIADYQGEARGYLRAATNWLHIYFEERKNKKDTCNQDTVHKNDFLEFAYTILNIQGAKSCANFLLAYKPKEFVFLVVQDLTRKLIDVGRFEEIDELILNFRPKPYHLVAVVSELMGVGKCPDADKLKICLRLLRSGKDRIKKPDRLLHDRITPAIICFLEACVLRNLQTKSILLVLDHYMPIRATRMVYDSHFEYERTIYLRVLAIKAVLLGESEVNIEAISPQEFTNKKKNYELDNEFREFTEVINGLFPWYLLRAQVLFDKDIKLLQVVDPVYETSKKARTNRYRTFDTLPNEIAQICATILVFYQQGSKEETSEFCQRFLEGGNTFRLADRLDMLRSAYRSSHLISIRQPLEITTRELIKSNQDDGPDEIANRYIALARAVLITSHDDASVYFDEAIKIASKFGDELVQRWEATVSLAKKACKKEKVFDELAYRFIRCAEMVGETVSREKHWSRSEAMLVCTKLSPGIGISALSRWRDRDIGNLEYQLETLLNELIGSKVIPSNVGWSLTRFFSNHQLNEFLSICLENEPSSIIKLNILEDAVHLLQIEGTSKVYWDQLKEIATRRNLYTDELNAITAFYKKGKKSKIPQDSNLPTSTNLADLVLDPAWDNIFDNLDISILKDFTSLIKRFTSNENKGDFRWNIKTLLKEAVVRIKENSLGDFINVIFLTNDLNHYNVQETLSFLSQAFGNKVSYQAKLPNIVYRFGERFSHDLTSEYSFNSFVNELNLDKILIEKFVSGILAGLANGNEFADASMFFGFVSLAASTIKNHDAVELVDYSLSRFELHINNEFGDGPWNEWLYVSNDVNKNIAGFIWSALGSPRSEVRWNAAHSVRKLAEFNCTNLIDALVSWLKYDKVDAFGSNRFPFYNLHAKQYLLIAFARLSFENPAVIYNYRDLLLNYALSEQHILIQKFAVEILLNIENAFPGTYQEDILNSIKKVGKSRMQVLEKEYDYSTESHWHIEGEVKTGIDFHFGWDFDRYWYKPLGDVFGIPGKQIEDLAANVIVKEWGLGDQNGYYKDPRVVLWNRSSRNWQTSHSHGSYPRNDNMDFYLSYHAMLVVAARLIEKMPVVKTREWSEDDPWLDWLSRHLLTRQDGKWLADCRDALPLSRPSWISEERKNSWQTDIIEEDFLNCLQIKEGGELWLNVEGDWHEKHNEQTEKFYISTALVSTKTSGALLGALATCCNSHDYKLPYYDEERMEIESGIFQLKGWINEHRNIKGVDEFDPHADEIDYPPYSLGSKIIESLGLNVDADGKILRYIHSTENVLTSETWSSHRERKDEEPDQSGMRMKAKLSFLKYLCSTLRYDLILDVGIKRDISYRYSENKREYSDPRHKIFILSADGKLRTTDTSYQLR